MTVSIETISSYFERLGWTFRVVSPTKIFTTYRCPVEAYYYVIGIEVIVATHWVHVRALLQRDISVGQFDAVLRLISDWNRSVYCARFLLVGDCVVLQSEIPVERLVPDAFFEALFAVCRYSELAGVEIAVLATNPSLRAVFDLAVAANRKPLWDENPAIHDLDLDFDVSVNRLPDPIAPTR